MHTNQAALAVAAVVALVAAVFDWRSRRIPNWLSVAALATGLLYRGITTGGAGLSDAAAGFAIAALPLLVLWLIGGGGGGDVKLMAGLSVWLGYQQSIWLLVGSAIGVLLVQTAVVTYRRLHRRREDPAQQPGLRVPFAIPVCLAAWALVAVGALQTVVHP
jgi:prepilin peptidase CpaA